MLTEDKRTHNATCREMSISKVVDDLLTLRPLPRSRASQDEHNIGLGGHPDVEHSLAFHQIDEAPLEPRRLSDTCGSHTSPSCE